MKHELQFTGAALVDAVKGYFVEELVKLIHSKFTAI